MLQQDLSTNLPYYGVRKAAKRDAPSDDTAMNANTTSRVDTIVEMFADNTAGESYNDKRLITEETDSGNVALVGYGWMKLAEYDETENHVTVFFGHKAIKSKTVTRWLNRVLEKTSDRRSVTISHESPTVRAPNEGVKFIGGYIGDFNESISTVEKKAVNTVIESLRFL